MGGDANTDIEQMMTAVVVEYLERDLVTPEGRRRAQRHLTNDEPAAALDLVLEDNKRNRPEDTVICSESID
ncbi:hypothetical protein D8Y22_15535 [Salinadaptatus halalkaliphilus]|uniref:Uncharacterized protein n=1 Tax=Salinadaptatus halalkaliphilus TaxID=2419781 RepID=A0A4S3TII4_9EURY|nr:hypothetical protein [Salinadaptatus halalkaliphilus]THE63756.1 hypothetical protein D8Y22_15535 [Salinadaptatus halalkaliphilus]